MSRLSSALKHKTGLLNQGLNYALSKCTILAFVLIHIAAEANNPIRLLRELHRNQADLYITASRSRAEMEISMMREKNTDG